MGSSPIRVFLVDDDPTYLAALEALLAAAGIAVVGTAPSGAEACDAVPAAGADVVTLDLDMPVMDGIETARALSRGAHPPAIVIVSGSDAPRDFQAAIDAGATTFIAKQDVPEQLVPLLHRLVSRD